MTESVSRYRSRALVLTGCLVLLLGAIVVRLGYLQILRHDELARLARSASTRRPSPGRSAGRSSTGNGYALAVSAPVESVYALPGEDLRPGRRGGGAGAPPRRARAGHRAAPGQRPPVRVGEGEDPAGARPRPSAPHRLPGIGTVPRPSGSIRAASWRPRCLGFVGRDDRGLEGVELAHDKSLAGEAGTGARGRDALGREMTGAADDP